MNRSIGTKPGAGVLSALCVAALGGGVQAVGADALPVAAVATHSWDNTHLSPERRAALLNRQLTLDLSSAAGRKVKRLIGFSKLELLPGEEKQVTVSVDSRLLADFDVARQRWRVAAGTYHIEVGASSVDVKLEGDAAVRGQWLKP